MATGRPETADVDPVTHVIDEYHHAERRVVCTCSWSGSTVPDTLGRSDWDRHVRSFRPPEAKNRRH